MYYVMATCVFVDWYFVVDFQESLSQYLGETEYEVGRRHMLLQMCVKPMQRAKYFCTGAIEDESLYRHYALCVPFYTHFTSPIRRYADIMVHRLLAAALGQSLILDYL